MRLYPLSLRERVRERVNYQSRFLLFAQSNDHADALAITKHNRDADDDAIAITAAPIADTSSVGLSVSGNPIASVMICRHKGERCPPLVVP